MNLSLRLNRVIETVEPCDLVCDVGCDHGFVSIALVESGVSKRALACDINEGPLKACDEHVFTAGLKDRIETRLSDGLHGVDISESPDCVIIAGMGGALITRILSEGKDRLKKASQLVLSPQSESFLVRKWLRENGYNIVKENMVFDMGKYYFIIDARPGETAICEPEVREVYDLYSGYLISAKDEVLREYLQKGLITNRGYLSGISPDKQETLIHKIQLIEKALSMME